ncbi:MAG: SpoIIE family protein phosphatase [Clostridia bacterium]|nr:SpoIIE family protein phosphatase [Clostridia bacterium]
MEHTTDSHAPRKAFSTATGARTHKDRAAAAQKLRNFSKGISYLGAAFLLGTCPFPFGALPLGFALLGGASSYTLYVWIGLCLSALHPSFPLPFWAGWLLYSGVLLFRSIFSRFSAPMTTSRVKNTPSALQRFTALSEYLWRGDEGDADTVTDYYYGKRNIPAKTEQEEIMDEEERGLEEHASPYFREPMLLRILSASLGCFALGLSLIFSRGFAVYDLLGFLISLFSAPLLTHLLAPCFGSEGEALLFHAGMPDTLPRRGHHHLLEGYTALSLFSVLSLLFFCTLAARQHILTLYSPYITLRLAPILALWLSLRITSARGLIPGMVVAILCGLAAAPLLSPAIILAVLAYGLLRPLSPKIAVAGGCIAAVLWTVAGGGTEQLVLYLPSLLVALPICLVMQKLEAHLPAPPMDADRTEAMKDFTSAMEQKTRAEAHRSRLEALSGAFTSLSHMFYELSGKLRKPKLPELRRTCDEVIDRHCARCRHREICDKAACHPADLMAARLSVQLYHYGTAEVSCLPPEILSHCRHAESIITDVNTRCAKLTEHLFKSEKTEVFATDYESVADLIRDTLDDDEEEYRCNREAADRIFDWLTARGVTVLGVVVCGKRNCRIIVRGSHFDRSEEGLYNIRSELEDICATRLTLPAFEAEQGEAAISIMRLSSAESYETIYSGSTVPAGTADGEPLPPALTNEFGGITYLPPATCGDHIALFKSENACFYALISDGMGSGEDASLTSDICALFLEKMLSAGNRVELSVRMLNSFIRQKNNGTGDECSATVDLMELDLMSGQAIFAKNGAAPTYVVRGGRVYKLRSRTLPIGILKDSDPQLLTFRMHPGDVVVMVSDGVTHGNDECPWLIDLLSEPLPESMDHLRLEILRHAIASGSPDDLSAIAVRVEEKQPSTSTKKHA